jgi:diketogulonate reductase-like aldo/keto reductase
MWSHGPFVYGTEFKDSPDPIVQAISAGFRAIDTAAQPRNCNEAAIGAGIERAIQDGIVSRSDLWIQTKFTPLGAQSFRGVLPSNMPYNAEDALEVMVEKSVRSSLRKLRTDYLDAVLLHEPLHTMVRHSPVQCVCKTQAYHYVLKHR